MSTISPSSSSNSPVATPVAEEEIVKRATTAKVAKVVLSVEVPPNDSTISIMASPKPNQKPEIIPSSPSSLYDVNLLSDDEGDSDSELELFKPIKVKEYTYVPSPTDSEGKNVPYGQYTLSDDDEETSPISSPKPKDEIPYFQYVCKNGPLYNKVMSGRLGPIPLYVELTGQGTGYFAPKDTAVAVHYEA